MVQEDQRVDCPLCAEHSHQDVMKWGEYWLLCCLSCGLVFANPLLIPPALYESADEAEGLYAHYLEIGQGCLHIDWAKRRFLSAVSAAGRLLDVGCSTGSFLTLARDRGWQHFGLELSKTAADVARRLTGAKVYTGSWDKVVFEERYNAITAWEVLEHLTQPVLFVQKMYDLLEPGGVFALSTPNWRSPWERRTRLPERRPPYHLTFWSRDQLRKLLSTTGFMDICIAEKPFAWNEEVGRARWVFLPLALILSFVFDVKGVHVAAIARKP